MHKLLLLLIIPAIIAVTTISFAANENSNGNNGNRGNSQNAQAQNNSNSNSNKEDKSNSGKSENAGKKSEDTPAATCDPNANWKNHGEYVSCVAKLHQGGATTSAAARSDVGKKHSTGSGSIKPTPSGSSTVSASPEISPSPESSESATPSASVAAITPIEEINVIITQIQGLLQRLQDLLPF